MIATGHRYLVSCLQQQGHEAQLVSHVLGPRTPAERVWEHPVRTDAILVACNRDDFQWRLIRPECGRVRRRGFRPPTLRHNSVAPPCRTEPVGRPHAGQLAYPGAHRHNRFDNSSRPLASALSFVGGGKKRSERLGSDWCRGSRHCPERSRSPAATTRLRLWIVRRRIEFPTSSHTAGRWNRRQLRATGSAPARGRQSAYKCNRRLPHRHIEWSRKLSRPAPG